MDSFLKMILEQFLSSQLFATLLMAAGAYLVTKFPVVAKALKAVSDKNLQAIVDRIYEQVKLQWATDGKIVKTADDVHDLITKIMTILQQMFPDTDVAKLRGMVVASVASPHTSKVTDPVIPTQ